MKKGIIALTASILLVATIAVFIFTRGEESGNSYKMVVEGFDWGPGVTKLIIALEKPVNSGTVNASDFLVSAVKSKKEPRIITDAYVSDENGLLVNGQGKYITLSLAVSPQMGNPFYFIMDYSTGEMGNLWSDPYTYEVSYTGTDIDNFKVSGEPNEKIMPLTDLFDLNGKFKASDGIELNYASYTPPADDANHPLIIWLHGAGEGSYRGEADPSVTLLGNRVTRLADEEIQKLMSGAYVLVPQSPTMWMDSGYGYTTDGSSIYTAALMELILTYVENTPNVDTERIYIGGCSNGGFMTMKMILTYPDYFAAAYPICEAYSDEWITDEQIELLMHIPIWFTQSKDDSTVAYNKFAVPTYERLIAAGAQNVWLSLYDKVVDTSGLYNNTDGTPYIYDGHWSWIYTLNNECTAEIDGKTVSIFEWLAHT